VALIRVTAPHLGDGQVPPAGAHGRRQGRPIQRADQYGAARVLGGTASAGVELLINERLAIRIAAEAIQLSLAFSGNGLLATSDDGDPSTADVRGATGRDDGGLATAAVAY
jgi:hypothetical protein